MPLRGDKRNNFTGAFDPYAFMNLLKKNSYDSSDSEEEEESNDEEDYESISSEGSDDDAE